MKDSNQYKYLNFTYQPLVNQIYTMLSEENKEKFKDAYEEISKRNNSLQVKPLYKLQYIEILIRKSAYLITSIISFLGVYVGGAFIKACLTWFIHGIILRTLLFSLYEGILQISYSLFHGILDSISNYMGLGNIQLAITENPWELPSDVWMTQLGYEIICYVFLFLLIWIVVNFVTFYLHNRKDWDKDAKHTFEYDVNRSLFMLQSDKDDTIEYVKSNFYKRYKRYIGSEFQTRKYITSYVNVIESRCLEIDSDLKADIHSIKKQKILMSKEAITHCVGWISYVFISSFVIIGPLFVYSNIMYVNDMESMMQGFGWWPSVSSFAISIGDSLFSNLSIYTNMLLWQKAWLGLWVLYMLFVLIKNFYKRFYRPTIRQYHRYYNYTIKKEMGIYDDSEVFKSVSVFNVWLALFLLIVLPSIIFVYFNI